MATPMSQPEAAKAAPPVRDAVITRIRQAEQAPGGLIILATAIEEDADVFLTGDTKLRRCTEVRVEVLEPIECRRLTRHTERAR